MSEMAIRSYRQWLDLSESERNALLQNQWNTYSREGYVVALTALSRLAWEFADSVVLAEVQLYHCGGYYLGMTLKRSCSPDLSRLPAQFEGFPVVWEAFNDDARPPID